jgi:hypothetical protein
MEPAGTADIEVCDFPRFEKSQRALAINTLGQVAVTGLGIHEDRASPLASLMNVIVSLLSCFL